MMEKLWDRDEPIEAICVMEIYEEEMRETLRNKDTSLGSIC